MQDKQVYEYAIIRLVPLVERGEFINIGLILLCKQKRFLKVQYTVDEQRILHFAPYVDLSLLRKHLMAFDEICAATKQAGLIGSLPVHERFRWLTAKRSTIIQCSQVHGGITQNLDALFEHLYGQYVCLPINEGD